MKCQWGCSDFLKSWSWKCHSHRFERRTWVRFPLGMSISDYEIWLFQEETFSYQNWCICNWYIYLMKMLTAWNVNECSDFLHEVESAIPIAYSAWWNHQEDVGSFSYQNWYICNKPLAISFAIYIFLIWKCWRMKCQWGCSDFLKSWSWKCHSHSL